MTTNPLLANLSPGISFEHEIYPKLQPLPGDPWIVSSALQKAIRRGETETAERAALSVLRYRGNGIFRRLIVIAFEDIGIGAPDLLPSITCLCSDPKLRSALGEPEVVMRAIVRALAAAAKDRSADYLICSATSRADWEPFRETAGRKPVADRIAMVRDVYLPLGARVTAAWFASGIEKNDQTRLGVGDLSGLMCGFAEMGLQQELVDAVHIAAKATKEPIVLMLPLIMEELKRCGGRAVKVQVAVPEARHMSGVPLFALDKHTRMGRKAISAFARQNDAVRESLERHVPEFRHREAAMMAAFYADAIPVSCRLAWDRADELEALGTATDLASAGIALKGMDDVLAAVRLNLDHLNNIRGRLLQNSTNQGIQQ